MTTSRTLTRLHVSSHFPTTVVSAPYRNLTVAHVHPHKLSRLSPCHSKFEPATPPLPRPPSSRSAFTRPLGSGHRRVNGLDILRACGMSLLRAIHMLQMRCCEAAEVRTLGYAEAKERASDPCTALPASRTLRKPPSPNNHTSTFVIPRTT